MSDVNNAVVAWRQQLERADGVTADDVMELESHLMQEMDSLQKSGLRPDESFVIAARRLGHPYELAAEYSKNDSLAMWKRPARLLLWGMLMLEVMLLLWSTTLVTFAGLGWNEQVLRVFQMQGSLMDYAFYAITLILLWSLAGRPQGVVANSLAKLEEAIQSNAGALSLLLGVVTLIVMNVFVRLSLATYLTQAQPGAATLQSDSLYSISFILQLLLPRLTWFLSIAVFLVVFARSEMPNRRAQLVRE